MGNNAPKSNGGKSTQTTAIDERRTRNRTAPSFPSRKGEKLVEGMTKAELVVKFAPSVKAIVYKFAKSLPGSVDPDDLISVGFIGLMDAADKFDPKKGFKFTTYAEFRVRGAILDELRSLDWVPRSIRDRAKEFEQVSAKLTAEKGRAPTDLEVSKALGVTIDQYQQLKNDIGAMSLVSYEDLHDPANVISPKDKKALTAGLDGEPASDPFIEASKKDTQAAMEKLFEGLSEDEKLVLSCYYYRGLNLREISQIMSVTESRVSQIHCKAIFKIREKLRDAVPGAKKMFLMLLEAA